MLKKYLQNNTYAICSGADLAAHWITLSLSTCFSLYLAASEQAVFNDALAEFDKYTCIKMKPRTNEGTYVDIRRGPGCSSIIGYVYWMDYAAPMNLGNNCLNVSWLTVQY